jgi:urea transport system ATP-binding protein
VFFSSTIDLLRYREAGSLPWASAESSKPTVFEHLSVFENLELALATDKGVRRSVFASWIGEKTASAARCCKPSTSPTVRSAPCRQPEPQAERRWLEIGMLLMQDRSCCCSGRPVAGMTKETRRTAQLFPRSRQTLADGGGHDMGFIRTISERSRCFV